MTRQYIRIGSLASRPDRPGMLPVCDKTIMRWVAAGKFPAPLQLGGTNIWDLNQVTGFLSKKPASPSPNCRGGSLVASPRRTSTP